MECERFHMFTLLSFFMFISCPIPLLMLFPLHAVGKSNQYEGYKCESALYTRAYYVARAFSPVKDLTLCKTLGYKALSEEWKLNFMKSIWFPQ
jgi:hypothetical protein